MNTIEKLAHILKIYYKRSMQSYIMTEKEMAAILSGTTAQYRVDIKNAFDAGRKYQGDDFVYSDVNEYLKIK